MLDPHSTRVSSWGVQGGASSTLVEARQRRIELACAKAKASIQRDHGI